MRRYRIRLYRGRSERLHDQEHVKFLDLTEGGGLAAAGYELDRLVAALAYADGARGADVMSYRLHVEEHDTGRHVLDWPATSPGVED